MIPLLMRAIVLTGAMAALAYRLAIYALPAIVAIAVARFAYATGLIGAGVVGLLGGAASFGLMAFLFATLRSLVFRLAVARIRTFANFLCCKTYPRTALLKAAERAASASRGRSSMTLE